MTEIELRGVTERDIDLLLLEELVAPTDFRDWFGTQAGLEIPFSLDKAARSVVTSTGESNLEVTYRCEEHRTRLLVENKIDATFQLRQAERYSERANAYVTRGESDKVVTVVIAPQSYADAVKGFERTVTYEPCVSGSPIPRLAIHARCISFISSMPRSWQTANGQQ